MKTITKTMSILLVALTMFISCTNNVKTEPQAPVKQQKQISNFKVNDVTMVFLLTQEQKDTLTLNGRVPIYESMNINDGYFLPMPMCDSTWIITHEEVDVCTNPNVQWVKDLPEVEYCAPPDNNPPPGE